MRIYVKDILKLNEETREKFNLVDLSAKVQDKVGIEQELIITPQRDCYLENDSNSLEDFIMSYVEVEDYNQAIFQVVVECEFKSRFYLYLKNYYSELKLSQQNSEKLDRYKKLYEESQKSSRKFEKELYEAYKQLEKKDKEILSLRRELERLKDKQSDSSSDKKDSNSFNSIPPELEVILDISKAVFGGIYGK